MRKIKYKSEALAAAHEAMQGLHEVGVVDDKTMLEFDAACIENRTAVPGDELEEATESMVRSEDTLLNSILEKIKDCLCTAYPAATMEDVSENSQILLSRLMFVINFEESNPDILGHTGYSLYSLRSVYNTLSDDPDCYMGWHRLINLFRVLEEGSESAKIPVVNSVLFCNTKAALLKDMKVMSDVEIKGIFEGLYLEDLRQTLIEGEEISTEEDYDKWFREQVEEAIREADPNTVWISNDEVFAKLKKRQNEMIIGNKD